MGCLDAKHRPLTGKTTGGVSGGEERLRAKIGQLETHGTLVIVSLTEHGGTTRH
jgi:hypothetical protein